MRKNINQFIPDTEMVIKMIKEEKKKKSKKRKNK